MHAPQRIVAPIILLLVVGVTAVWWLQQQNQVSADQPLQASGTVEGTEISIASESSGRVVEVLVTQGQAVRSGDPLLRLDDTLLQAQRSQAEAALSAAQAALDSAAAAQGTAQAAVNSAQANLDTLRLRTQAELSAARLEERPLRNTAWRAPLPEDYDLPVWYFQKSEEIAGAESELELALRLLETERTALEEAIAAAGSANLRAAESSLLQARLQYEIAADVLAKAELQNDDTLVDQAQAEFDLTETALQDAQAVYDELLSDETAADLLEARARFTIAQERYEAAQDARDLLLTGANSLRVRIAESTLAQGQAALAQAQAALAQTELAVTQAEQGVRQAQAALDLIDVRLAQLVVSAPVDGVVLSRSAEPGEVLTPGGVALTLGQLENLTITVYVSEDRYGQISLGQTATVQVDSFPGQTFSAAVVRIADQAEFTPRNVQTEEGRSTTVFAVELSVANPQGLLKPGMPADVTFSE